MGPLLVMGSLLAGNEPVADCLQSDLSSTI